MRKFGFFAAVLAVFAVPALSAGSIERDMMPYHCTDVWESGFTDLPDFAFFASHYSHNGVCDGDASGRYDVRADFDSSGCTDQVDFAIFKQYFIRHTPNAENRYCMMSAGNYNCPDITGPQGVPDGQVSLRDFVMFANSYGKSEGQPGYDYEADFNADGSVNEIDYAIFAKAFHDPTYTYYCQ